MWAPEIMTSRHQESGSFKRPGAVYSGWLFVDLRGSSTSLDTIWSTGVPGYAAPVSTDSLWCPPIGDTSHQWSPVSAERECLPHEASGSDSPRQLVSACATASCCGPICHDHASTVYPKKYAHGYCFAVLCCGYTLTDFPTSIRLTSLALWQSNDCPSASKATLMNMDKYFMWNHYERLHNHNKAKHNKTVCIFIGIYCTCCSPAARSPAIQAPSQCPKHRIYIFVVPRPLLHGKSEDCNIIPFLFVLSTCIWNRDQ